MNRFAIATGALLLMVASVAEAQWVMLARRAVGRVEQMSQQSPTGGASYDTAAVMLEAPADKVYAAVLRSLGNNAQGLKITREVPADFLVEFTNGQQVAGIKISGLGEQLSHMMITSAHTGTQPNAAALVVNGVLRVCREMSVECSQARQ